jgi:hypothetical protein
MAPTVKRIMTQPIVSTHCAIQRPLPTWRGPGIGLFFFLDGDLISLLTISFIPFISLLSHTQTEPDLPLPAVEADGSDLAVRAGRLADRRADYRECFSFVEFPPLSIKKAAATFPFFDLLSLSTSSLARSLPAAASDSSSTASRAPPSLARSPINPPLSNSLKNVSKKNFIRASTNT